MFEWSWFQPIWVNVRMIMIPASDSEAESERENLCVCVFVCVCACMCACVCACMQMGWHDLEDALCQKSAYLFKFFVVFRRKSKYRRKPVRLPNHCCWTCWRRFMPPSSPTTSTAVISTARQLPSSDCVTRRAGSNARAPLTASHVISFTPSILTHPAATDNSLACGTWITCTVCEKWGVGIAQWLECRTHDWKVETEWLLVF